MLNSVGNLVCSHCNRTMVIAVVEKAGEGVRKYVFECCFCERTRTIELAAHQPDVKLPGGYSIAS